MKNIKLVILDVDGTMTDGKIYYDNLGNELKAFNVKDGMAISYALRVGLEIAIITGRDSAIVRKRAFELGVKYLYQGIDNKLEALNNLIHILKLNYEEIMYIGDDINDILIIKHVGYGACPSDACADVINICDMVSTQKGGEGAVREILEIILRKQGKWIDKSSAYYKINQ